MDSALRDYLTILGRLLLASVFLVSGPGKVLDPSGTAAFMASGGLPQSAPLAVLVGLFEIGAGVLLVVGFRMRFVAGLLAVYTLLASLLFHRYWDVPQDMHLVTLLLFQKNVSIVGALIFAACLGAGPLSLDSRRGTAKSSRMRTSFE